MVGLNTLYFGAKSKVDPEQEEKTFNWFENVLVSSGRHERFIPFFHIWPGMNYMDHQNLHWQEPKLSQMETLIKEQSHKISMLVGAHTHFMDFMFMGEEAEFDNLFISPSLSPVFKNNPGLSFFDITPENEVENVRVQFMQLQKKN